MTWNGHRKGKSPNEIKICKTAKEFLDKLISLPMTYSKYNRHSIQFFIYRGHSDASWPLLPTALRKAEDDASSAKKLWDMYDGICGMKCPTPPTTNELGQRCAEHLIMKTFYQRAQASGLSLPEIDQKIHEELMTPLELEFMPIRDNDLLPHQNDIWPRVEYLSILALAQHYGLPTRLLDWSRSALTAAYFAASGAIKQLSANNDSCNSNLCVWAAPVSQFDRLSKYSDHINIKDRKYANPVHLLTVPTAQNPNLKLQQGVFTIMMDVRNNDDDLHGLPNRIELNKIEHRYFDSVFLKLCLPYHQAPELMYLIGQLGFSADRLYDGFQGAAYGSEEIAKLGIFFSEMDDDNQVAIQSQAVVNWPNKNKKT